ncbi:MAG: TauD/TfdA family dioxygenase [Gammaproteobacteria bacterium]
MEDFNIEGTFPVVITPGRRVLNLDEFNQKLQENKPQLEQLLLKHGALLLRGFPVHCAAHFSDVITALNLGNFVNYIGGDSPRDRVENRVYTSTEAPPHFHIPLHQELSYIKNFPRHIYFYCEVEPLNHGETIIADARRVYEELDYGVKQRFQDKGLTYTSRYYYKSKIMQWVNQIQRSHKSWTEVFETTNKDDVEQKCIENEFAWKWLPRDWIEIKQTRPALLKHPQTNEDVWFNQAHLYDFNPKLLGWKNYVAAKLFYFRKSTRLHEIVHADGSHVDQKDLYHILDVLNQNTVAYPWQKGDVMVLDNILAMHGRAPFSGPRRILTALTA